MRVKRGRGSPYFVAVVLVISEGLHGILELCAHRLEHALALRVEELKRFHHLREFEPSRSGGPT